MYGFIELLKYSLPALIFAIAFYYIYKEKGNQEAARKAQERKHERQMLFLKTMIPLRVQAYERVVLLLERITPQNLIMRVNRPGMAAIQLKSSLTASIREEFDHNMSQQVFLSSQNWELVKNAKEEMINLINTSFAELPPNAVASELIRNIFDKYLSGDKPAVEIALNAVKKEMENHL